MGAKMQMLSQTVLTEAAECLKVMAHPVRLRIADILMQGHVTVGAIAKLCKLPPSQASEHLRLMKACGLLDAAREGRAVYYRIANPSLPGLIRCIRSTCGKAAG